MTAKVRIEFMLVAQPGADGGDAVNQPGQVLLVQELSISGGPVASAPAPQFGTFPGGAAILAGSAKIIALQGAVNVNWAGAAASETNASRAEPTSPIIVPIVTGATLSLIEAADSDLNSSEDPVFDHVNGVLIAVGTGGSALLTPGASCKYARISSDADVLIRTDGTAAAVDARSIQLYAKAPEVIPVVPGSQVSAITASGTANVRATPMKTR